jgi:membrane protein
MTEPNEPSLSGPEGGPPAEEVASPRAGRLAEWRTRAERYRSDLESRPRVGFLLRSVRRFNEMEGKHLSLVIAMNLFVAIIPLFIVGYAILVAFNPDRSFGSFVVNAFHLTGKTAEIVDQTFSNARSGRSTALSISVISLLITGLDVSATVQLAYARAFGVTQLAGVRKYLRGGAWLLIMLAVSGTGLALRSTAAERSHWVLVLVVPLYLLVQFGFYLVTPRLLLDLSFAWRDLAPGAVVCTGAAVIVGAVSSFQLHRWVSGYGHAYGSFGIALSMIAYVGVIALFWVWVAAIMGTYWENKAGSAEVEAMHELSAEQARS